jgi:hypothetical protein
VPLEQVRRSQAISKSEFHARLRIWLADTHDIAVGPEEISYKGAGWVYVRDGSDIFVLHADTPREAVYNYLQLVGRYGDDLRWEVAESRRHKMTAVVYGPENMRLTPFYLYHQG